jgi:hypothetical protein
MQLPVVKILRNSMDSIKLDQITCHTHDGICIV